MIYDYNTTSGWRIPSSVTSIDDQAFLSSAGTFYGESGSAAENFAEGDSSRDFTSYDEDNSVKFTIAAGENGYIQPNGTHTLPSDQMNRGCIVITPAEILSGCRTDLGIRWIYICK